MRQVHDLTPFMETPGPPFLFFTGTDEEALRIFAAELGVHVGVAETRTMARLAALRTSRGHVLCVNADQEQRFLDGFHVRRLAALGVPRDMTGQMELFGHTTLGSLRRLTLRHMKAQFGSHGEHVYRFLHPEPESPITAWRPPLSVVVERVWPESVPVAEQMLRSALEELVDRAVDELGGRRTQCIGLVLDVAGRADTGPAMRRHILQEPAHRAETILHVSWRLLQASLEYMDGRSRDSQEAGCLDLDGLALHLEALQRPDVHQKDFFDARPAIRNAVRTIQKRYPGVLRKARLRPHALFDEDRSALETVEPDGPPDD